jgi:hypothetical protein
VEKILARESGLQNFTRRSLTHQLSDAQKKSRVEFSGDFLEILEDHWELQFDGIPTSDEFGFDI